MLPQYPARWAIALWNHDCRGNFVPGAPSSERVSVWHDPFLFHFRWLGVCAVDRAVLARIRWWLVSQVKVHCFRPHGIAALPASFLCLLVLLSSRDALFVLSFFFAGGTQARANSPTWLTLTCPPKSASKWLFCHKFWCTKSTAAIRARRKCK